MDNANLIEKPQDSSMKQLSESKTENLNHNEGKGNLNSRIYIGHLSSHTSEKDLYDIFGRFGNIVNLEKKFNWSFNKYKEVNVAKFVISRMHGASIDRYRIVVEEAIPKQMMHAKRNSTSSDHEHNKDK